MLVHPGKSANDSAELLHFESVSSCSFGFHSRVEKFAHTVVRIDHLISVGIIDWFHAFELDL